MNSLTSVKNCSTMKTLAKFPTSLQISNFIVLRNFQRKKIFPPQNKSLFFKKLRLSFYLMHETYQKLTLLNLEACSTLRKKIKFSITQTCIKLFFLKKKNWDSLHARLNSHHKAWSYMKKKQKKIKAHRKSV